MSADHEGRAGGGATRPVPIAPDVVAEAITHHRAGRLGLAELGQLMIELATRPEARADPAGALVRALAAPTQVEVEAETTRTSPPERPAAGAEGSQRARPTAETRRLRPSTGAHAAPASEPSDRPTTRLDRFARARGVVPAVHPGLDPSCPDIGGDGDPRHAIGRRLGEGGVGQVLLGVDRDLRRPVALKVLREEHRRDPIMLQTFLEEAIITGGLEHPNIVPVHELGVSAELGPYYTMKRLDGDPLSELLGRLRRGEASLSLELRLGRLIELYAQTLRAVAFAHDHGVIHCDLKPANIIVGRYGDVTVVDWGLAKVLGEAGRRQARAMLWSGSPGYMAPEQALSPDVSSLDERADIWSLGAILYEILTLALPFADPDGSYPEGIQWRSIPPPRERSPDRPIPEALESLCMAALAREPGDRLRSVRAMLEAVEDWLHGIRERERQREAASDLLSEATEALHRVRGDEEAIDRLQAASPPGALGPAEEAALEAARERLLAGYEGARSACLAGLALNPQGAGLKRAIAALYWYTFQRLYPARQPTSAAGRDQALALLESLARVALDAILARGAAKGATVGAPTGALGARLRAAADPWLEVAWRMGQVHGGNATVDEVVERVIALGRASIFEGTPGHELLPVAAATERAHHPAHHRIFSAGEAAHAIYFLLSGEVAIERDGRALSTLTPPACFGEIAVIDGSTRTASAACRTAVEVLVLEAGRFRELMTGDGRIALQVMRVLARRLRAATDREMGRSATAAPGPP